MLAVDDEAPALDELTYLLRQHPAIGQVRGAADATAALRELHEGGIDAVFLDINMPGLSGLELAAVLANFTEPPAVVFVTAHDDKAVAAFDVGAVDYLLKPIRRDRLDEAVRRVAATRAPEPARPASDDRGRDRDVIPAELGGVTQLVRRDTIGWVEAEGDYARLHAASGSHLVRIPLSTLETRWRECGFPTCPPLLPGGAGDGHRDAHQRRRDRDGAAPRQRRVAGGGAAGQPTPGPRAAGPADSRPDARLPPGARR